MTILVKTQDLDATLKIFDPKNTVAKAIVRLGDAFDLRLNSSPIFVFAALSIPGVWNTISGTILYSHN